MVDLLVFRIQERWNNIYTCGRIIRNRYSFFSINTFLQMGSKIKKREFTENRFYDLRDEKKFVFLIGFFMVVYQITHDNST